MAPVCVCGHKASEHFKQMGMRTYCTQLEGTEIPAYEESWQCECLIYRPREGK